MNKSLQMWLRSSKIEDASGMKINYTKSTIAGINIYEAKVNALASNQGLKVAIWSISYLGMPLGE